MIIKLCISFDNEAQSFYPGYVIRGKVTLENEYEVKVKGLTLTFLGDAEVYWTEAEASTDTVSLYRTQRSNHSQDTTHRRRHVHKEFRNQESVLWHEVVLFGQGEAEGGNEYIIEPGVREYPFEYKLPDLGLPSTYSESPFGSIKYTAEARLKRPLFRYDKVEKEFIVNGISDIDLVPRLFHPIGVNERIDIGWICCPEGYMTFDLQLPKSGFIRGESVPFTVSIVNLSNSLVEQMFATFKQIISCEPFVDPFGVASWNESFVVPSLLPPSTLAGCRVITFNYIIKVTVRTPEKTCYLSCPIFIGTGPCPIAAFPAALSVVDSPTPVQSTVQEEYDPALNPFLNAEQEDEMFYKNHNGKDIRIAFIDEESDGLDNE